MPFACVFTSLGRARLPRNAQLAISLFLVTNGGGENASRRFSSRLLNHGRMVNHLCVKSDARLEDFFVNTGNRLPPPRPCTPLAKQAAEAYK